MRGPRRRCPARYVELVVDCSRCGQPATTEADPPLCRTCFGAEIDRLTVHVADLGAPDAARVILDRLAGLGLPTDVLAEWTEGRL